MKKILFLVTQSVWGGAQRYVFDLASHFASRGWDVTVAAGEDPEGELFARLQDTGVHAVYLSRLKRPLSPLNDVAAIAEIYQLCRSIRPQIVHLNSSKSGFLGALAARFARVPKIIYTVHGLVLKEPLAPIIKLIYWLAEWFAGKLRDVTICVSEDDHRAAIRAHIAKPQNIVTIPIGIKEISFLTRDEARLHLSKKFPPLNAAATWIGTIAGLYATKGLDTLLESAKTIIQKNPEFHFLIIGEGPERNKLEQFIAANHLQKNCHLLGHIPDAAVYLKAFDCFALPSLKEGLPYTILEALAAHIPIVATRVGGIPEVMEENAMYRLIDPKDSFALTEVILSVLSATSTVRESPPKPIPTLQTMIAATERVYLN